MMECGNVNNQLFEIIKKSDKIFVIGQQYKIYYLKKKQFLHILYGHIIQILNINKNLMLSLDMYVVRFFLLRILYFIVLENM